MTVTESELPGILDEIGTRMQGATERGAVASYIPQLARVDPGKFGMAVALPDGTVHRTGDAEEPFSIQSVSKVFTLALALGRFGDALWTRVGREPSGQPFNSILQLEYEHGRPRNPFINAGAIVVTDAILSGHAPKELLGEILRFVRTAAGQDPSAGRIHIDAEVARSEQATGHRNFALAHFIAAHGNLQNPVERTLGCYFHQCAIAMSCVELAQAGLFLTNAPGVPRLVSPGRVRRINAMMLT
jgi:glutaminase